MARVLLVEDDTAIADPLSRALRRDGHDVEAVGSGATALARWTAASFDLVILDLGLPDIDGLEVCRRIRAADRRVPVLVLTARSDELDVVIGLDSGADDYVTKPFRLAELLARVRSRLRDADPTDVRDQDVRGQDVRVDPAGRRVWRADAPVELTAKEFELLLLLVRNAGRVVARRRLMREVWDIDWDASTKTLDVHLASLRRKLGDDPVQPRYITTVRGVGLRFETA